MLHLPARTKELPGVSSNHHGFVLTSIANLSPWLSDNKTVFFPEYTDHSFTHLNEVLLTADSIISDDSWSHLTPQDAAAMIISVLLHDCAMHISEDGFYTLINDNYPPIKSRYVATEPKWGELWLEFMAEAKRFDAKKLLALFGDEKPVKNIPTNKIDLTGRDRLLIGEFIRRHHARIAHEIAFNGIPGTGATPIKLCEEPEPNFLDLCGFIAKSHNMSLRNAVDKLEKHKKQIHLNTHVPFIMLVLRIADYIQIHAERAPKKLLTIKALISPISKGEWDKHSSIIEINQAHDDPEALYVDAEPENALIFESLISLFKSIQNELDLSWSVLGEVYGRHQPLTDLGITIRRIKSSLDDVNYFITTKAPGYIPKVLKFRTADSEMMELLIAPLYGNNPEAGVRELMQNAIDACIELKDLIAKQKAQSDPQKNIEVCVTLIDNGESGGELIIEDSGIGMTLDVVENYFLNIGASFRNSDRWKKEHETSGHSNVYRTGRFGIGLLAAYLLGDEIRVETRSIKEPSHKGLKFNCRKGSKSITVTNIEAKSGTKISITLNTSMVEKLREDPESWDWFSLEEPRVIRKIVSDKEETLEQSRKVPGTDSSLKESGWFRTETDDFDDVFWSFKKVKEHSNYHGRTSTLICNGIIITDNLRVNNFHISSRFNLLEVETPSLVVFDQDGRLPITLDRTDLIGRTLPFEEQLTTDLSKYLVTEILEQLHRLDIKLTQSLLSDLFSLPVDGMKRSYYSNNEDTCKFIICQNSLIPLDFDIIKKSKIANLCVDAVNLGKGQGSWQSKELQSLNLNYLAINNISNSKQSRSYWLRIFFEINQSWTRDGISSLPIVGRRVLIRKSDIAEIVAPGYVPKTFWNRLNTEWSNERWALLNIGVVPEFTANIQTICNQLDETNSLGTILYYLDWEHSEEEDTPTSKFANAWLAQNGSFQFNAQLKTNPTSSDKPEP